MDATLGLICTYNVPQATRVCTDWSFLVRHGWIRFPNFDQRFYLLLALKLERFDVPHIVHRNPNIPSHLLLASNLRQE